MHKLVYLKLKPKIPPESDRLADKESGGDDQKTNHSLPVLDFSSPDSKSFRASVILPDLSRRFTLLRTNGELITIDNFQKHLRYERESGQITQEDEGILMNQYQWQYLSEAPSSSFNANHSPTSPNYTSSSPTLTRKTSSTGVNVLFSASTSARDAAYLQKAMKMSNTLKSPSSMKPRTQSSEGASADQSNSSKGIDDLSRSPLSPVELVHEAAIQSNTSSQFEPLESVDEESEADIEEISLAQLQRLSLAADRILGSHLEQHEESNEPGSTPVDQHDSHQRHATNNHNNTSTFAASSDSVSPDAELRVHEELLKALPDCLSSTAAPSLASSQTNAHTAQYPDCMVDSALSMESDSLPLQQSNAFPVISPTLSNESLSNQFYEESLNILCDGRSDHYDSAYEDEESEVEAAASSSPIFDRNQPLPFVNLTYDELMYIQGLLVQSAHGQQTLQRTPTTIPPTSRDIPLSYPTSPNQGAKSLPQQSHCKPSGSLSNVANHTSSHYSSQNVPQGYYPRSSSLQSRSHLIKTIGVGHGQKSRTGNQSTHTIQSPQEPSFSRATPNFIPQLISPSSTESPDISSFPLTPPIHQFVSPSGGGQSNIPSPNISPDANTSLSRGAINGNNQTRSPNLNARAGRPKPTTELFKDVEAQAVAANVALHKPFCVEHDGRAKNKRVATRKKSISVTQIGAPKLVSASADLPGLPLDPMWSESNHNHCRGAKGISYGGLKQMLKKKRPSESGSINQDAHLRVDHSPLRTLKSADSLTYLHDYAWNNEPNFASFNHTGDTANVSLTRMGKHTTRDRSEPPGSWKHPQALTSLRKLMNRNRKPGSRVDPDSLSPSNSISESSDVVLPDGTLPPAVERNHPDYELENESATAWPSSTAKSFSPRSMSQLLNNMRLPPPESTNDNHNSDPPLAFAEAHQHTIEAGRELSWPEKDAPSSSGATLMPDLQKECRESSNNDCKEPTDFQWEAQEHDASTNERNSSMVDNAKDENSELPANSSDLAPVCIIHPVDDTADEKAQLNPDAPSGEDPVNGSHTEDDSATNPSITTTEPSGLQVQGGGLCNRNSGYASSILDLYGYESCSSVSEQKRESSTSCYSSVHLSRPNSVHFPSNHIQPSRRRSFELNANQASSSAMSSSDSQPSLSDPLQTRIEDTKSADNEVMVMLQQLQNSTRYSKFDPAPSSLLSIPSEDLSPDSFIKHIVQGHPAGNLIQSVDSKLNDKFVDDGDDEAEVWKQILDG